MSRSQVSRLATSLDAIVEDFAPAGSKEHWHQLWSNNSLERLNREIRRRT